MAYALTHEAYPVQPGDWCLIHAAAGGVGQFLCQMANLRGGRVIGDSDELGYRPRSRPVTPGEVAATIYRGLGIDIHRELAGPQNRPIPLVDFGVQPIRELF